MGNTITFNREELDEFKSKCDQAKQGNATSFVWKGSLNNINQASILIDKLERSPNLSIQV